MIQYVHSTHKAVRETTLGADNMTSQASLGAWPNSCTQLQGAQTGLCIAGRPVPSLVMAESNPPIALRVA